jgi:ABC-type multidrug transport system fused ATPase/permease subunit
MDFEVERKLQQPHVHFRSALAWMVFAFCFPLQCSSNVSQQGLFIVFVLLTYALQYLPFIRKLNEVMKRTRGMLLMFAEEMLLGVPSIKAILQEYALCSEF